MAYKAKDVADYVIWYANKIGKRITNLQLQKIMYYLQAYYLVEVGTELFQEPVEKWKLGPVVDNVYQEYKGYGAKNIDIVPDKVEFDFESGLKIIPFKIVNSPIIKNNQNNLNLTIKSLLKFDGFELVKKTHKQPMWHRDKQKIDSGIRHIKYNNQEIKDFFLKHRNEQLWKER